MPKVVFAVSFVVAVLGAVLLLISQVPLTREYYEVVDTRSFSDGEPLTFLWTFEPNIRYRFTVKGANWANQPYYNSHYLNVGGSMYSYDTEGALVENPLSWLLNNTGAPVVTQTLNVTFYGYGTGQIDQAFTPTSVEISVFKETTYHLTYLIYVALPLLIIGAILITITGKEKDSRTRMPNTSEIH